MNFVQSVSNLFRPTQQVTVAQPNPADKIPQQNPAAEVNVNAPAAAPTPPPNPLDNFADIWKTDPNKAAPADPLAAPLLNTDPTKIAEAAGKLDFVGHLPQELLQKAMSGSDPQAFMQVMNAVAQRTLATATQLTSATIEQATQRNNQRIDTALPDRVRKIQLDAMQPENPVLQHPASQPLLKLVRSQIQMNNPGMSPQEIQTRTEQYLTQFASQLSSPASSESATRTPGGATDWDTWAST